MLAPRTSAHIRVRIAPTCLKLRSPTDEWRFESDGWNRPPLGSLLPLDGKEGINGSSPLEGFTRPRSWGCGIAGRGARCRMPRCGNGARLVHVERSQAECGSSAVKWGCQTSIPAATNTGESHLAKRPGFLSQGQPIPILSCSHLSRDSRCSARGDTRRRRYRKQGTGHESSRSWVHVLSLQGLNKPCARHDSNVRPLPPQGSALSPELRARGGRV